MNRALRGSQRGALTVEFGLILIPLVTLMFAVAEYSRSIYQFNTMTKSVRAASRYLAQRAPGDQVSVQLARCMVVSRNGECGGPAAVVGLTEDLVEVCDRVRCPTTHAEQSAGDARIDLVGVTVRGFRFRSVVWAMVPDFQFPPISATMEQVQ